MSKHKASTPQVNNLLSQHDVDQLRESRVTDPLLIQQAGLRTITDPILAEAAVGRPVPVPVLAFPNMGINGSANFTVLKPANPRILGSGKPCKYEHPSKEVCARSAPYFATPALDGPKAWADIDRPIYITEGQKKALALAQLGLLTVGLHGVWHFMEPVPEESEATQRYLVTELVAILQPNRDVYICYDGGDTTSHTGVIHSEARLAKMLRAEGVNVRLVRVPFMKGGPKVGIDDHLVSFVTDEEATAEVTRLCEEAPRADPVHRVQAVDDTPDPLKSAAGLMEDLSFIASLHECDETTKGQACMLLRKYKIAKKTIEEAIKSFRGKITPDAEAKKRAGVFGNPNRPVISWHPSETGKTCLEVEEQIAALDPTVFQRGGNIVFVRFSGLKVSVHQAKPAAFSRRLTDLFGFESVSDDGGKPIGPPPAVVNGVLEQCEWHNINSLKGVMHTPIFRANGTMADQPGFDKETGYYYAPSMEYLPVVAEPSLEDAQESLDRLIDVFIDMPHVSHADKIVPVANILTVLARSAIDGPVPAFIYSASVQGSGKCLGLGTPVLMYDGRTVPVQDVKEGDLLMGPDSTPRRVMSTTTGSGELYRVVPVKGDPWVCNDVHVLTLTDSSSGRIFDEDLPTYLARGEGSKTRCMLFTPEPGIDFQAAASDLPVDPYFLGVWYGDGSKSRRGYCNNLNGVVITKPDEEILTVCSEQAVVWGLCVTPVVQDGKCPGWRLTTGVEGRPNPLLNALTKLYATGKHLPHEYLTASRASRQAMLAGLLDTDGSLSGGCYDIIQKERGFAEGICFLARSLGKRATLRAKKVKLPGWEEARTYWRVSLSGDFTDLPMRIPRKIASSRKQIKHVNRTGFRVNPVGIGPYAGFTLDGDGRFLLGDFTVTHNTLQTQIVSLIATGHYVSALGFPSSDDEMEKRMCAAAREGSSLLLLDNVAKGRAFGGPAIDKVLTALGGVKFRLLGVNETPEYTWTTVLMATGNQFTWQGDGTERRILVSRIESPLEKPDRRPLDNYKHPERADVLPLYVRTNRAQLVRDAFTILRAYVVAGKPAVEGAMGGFDAWSKLVRNAICWVGGPDADVLKARPREDDVGDASEAAEIILIHFMAEMGEATASNIQHALFSESGKKNPDLDDAREALEVLTGVNHGSPSPKQVAAALGKLRGKVRDGMVVRHIKPVTNGRQPTWKATSSVLRAV